MEMQVSHQPTPPVSRPVANTLIQHLLGLMFGSGTTADILIAASLYFSLSRSRTGFNRY
jgi:hypothetical protein